MCAHIFTCFIIHPLAYNISHLMTLKQCSRESVVSYNNYLASDYIWWIQSLQLNAHYFTPEMSLVCTAAIIQTSLLCTVANDKRCIVPVWLWTCHFFFQVYLTVWHVKRFSDHIHMQLQMYVSIMKFVDKCICDCDRNKNWCINVFVWITNVVLY